MKQNTRIRTARRHLNCSQAALADAVGVQRSAVSQWEALDGKNPTLNNLRKVAKLTAVQFEWLATGRGPMALDREMIEEVVAAHALLIESSIEMRMIKAFRSIASESQLSLVEIAEQMAKLRSTRSRPRKAK